MPTGYSFNLDGTNIYMTLATLFLAQATNTHLTFGQERHLLIVAMLTSKGAAGVTGAGFITLAATLAVVPDIPVAALAVLVGVDRFMSQCRALTNFIGNGVATLVIAAWEKQLDRKKLKRELSAGPAAAELTRPAIGSGEPLSLDHKGPARRPCGRGMAESAPARISTARWVLSFTHGPRLKEARQGARGGGGEGMGEVRFHFLPR